MVNRKAGLLLLLSGIDRVVLQGIYPVLPVLVAGKGVKSSYNGLFMAVTYLAISFGSWFTPRLLTRIKGINRISVIIGLLTAVSLAGMGLSQSIGYFTAFTASYWLLSGIQINIYGIIMSYVCPPAESGKHFGLLANTTLIGAIIGSFLLGPLMDYVGITSSFIIMATITFVVRLAIYIGRYEGVYHKNSGYTPDFKVSKSLWLLIILLNVGMFSAYIGRFNMSLIMKDFHFSLASISNVFAWGALFVLPFPYLFGILSQRISPKLLLGISLLCVSLAAFILAWASQFIAFVAVAFLISIMTYCSRGVTQKMIYDMYPLSQQKHAQSLLSSANWVAGIAGFASIGIVSGFISPQLISLFCAAIGVLAMFLLPIIK